MCFGQVHPPLPSPPLPSTSPLTPMTTILSSCHTVFFKAHWVHLVSLVCAIYQSVGCLSGPESLKKTGFPFPRSHQSPSAPQPEVGIHGPLAFTLGFQLARSLTDLYVKSQLLWVHGAKAQPVQKTLFPYRHPSPLTLTVSLPFFLQGRGVAQMAPLEPSTAQFPLLCPMTVCRSALTVMDNMGYFSAGHWEMYYSTGIKTRTWGQLLIVSV